MKPYIPKSDVVAEIERLDNYWHLSKSASGQAFVESLLSFLDTLEIKEVDYAPMDNDFERDAVNFCLDNGLNTTPRIAKTIAKHFFELGLKVNKSFTWEDIANINEIVCEILKEGAENILYDTQEDFCKEVLKRFKTQKRE